MARTGADGPVPQRLWRSRFWDQATQPSSFATVHGKRAGLTFDTLPSLEKTAASAHRLKARVWKQNRRSKESLRGKRLEGYTEGKAEEIRKSKLRQDVRRSGRVFSF